MSITSIILHATLGWFAVYIIVTRVLLPMFILNFGWLAFPFTTLKWIYDVLLGIAVGGIFPGVDTIKEPTSRSFFDIVSTNLYTAIRDSMMRNAQQ